MLDRSETEAAIYRVAIAAFTYYPEKHVAESGYTLDEDLDWCLRPLRQLAPSKREELRRRIRELITDPAADRQSFIRHLKSLTGE